MWNSSWEYLSPWRMLPSQGLALSLVRISHSRIIVATVDIYVNVFSFVSRRKLSYGLFMVLLYVFMEIAGRKRPQIVSVSEVSLLR